MEENRVCIEFESKSQNEGFARVAVSAFVSQLDPTIEEIADVKTKIPMIGRSESLNAGVAASILAYEVVRQNFKN